jgi:NAD(P)-dependent dehydrogenase (short-subunit alcohol dehydrogenase family)
MTTAIVTGAASGVGAATAVALAAQGVRVAVCDVDPAGKKIADRCDGLFVALDVADPSAWLAAVETVTARLGPVELAHLNAGVMTAAPDEPIEAAMDLSQVSADRFDRIVGVNLGGVVHGLRSLWASMAARGSGAIVATASTAGLSGYPFDPLYSATKHGVVGLVRAVAPVLRAQGVRVQAICPGGVDTPLLPEYGRATRFPLLRPDQVADAVVGLLLIEREGSVFTISHDQPDAVLVPDPVVGL